MKTFRLSVLLALLLPVVSVHADQYGSETTVKIEGFYRVPVADKVTELNTGITRVVKSFRRVEVSNRTVLDRLVKEDLIPTVKDYSIVMVAPNTHDAGVKFFAVRTGRTPVEIPGEFFGLNVSDGPGTGVIERDNQERLRRLDVVTSNYAVLTLPRFQGAGILRQKWSFKTVRSEQVQLVDSSGGFAGKLTNSAGTGVGSIDLTLSEAKTVSLSKYGMATDDGGTGGDDGVFGSGSVNTSIGGTLILAGAGTVMNTSHGPNTQISTGVITFNTSLTVPGLSLAFDGAAMPVVSTSNSANELTITTADGPVVYTREGGAVWTLVAPAADSVE